MKDKLLKTNTSTSHINRELRSKVIYSVSKSRKICEFCKGDKRIYIGNDNMVSIDNYYNQLLVSHIKKKSKIVGIMDINYCPKCGRKIREDKDDKYEI